MAAPLLFGAGAVLSKTLLGSIEPLMLAGLLYLAAGIGLGTWLLLSGSSEAPLRGSDLLPLILVVGFGGVVGPALLMFGLTAVPASLGSLLLNLEAPLTVLLAGLIFKEHVGSRVALGTAFFFAGGAAVSWTAHSTSGSAWGPLLVTAACTAWAIDNNISRRLAGRDPVQTAAVKCLCAGAFNISLALASGGRLPEARFASAACLVGLLSYGLSLVLYLTALRELGTARVSSYFSLAPFIGAAAGVLLLKEPVTGGFILAAVLMSLGLWLNLGERHEHAHRHDEVHEHRHVHDVHHRHVHAEDPGREVEHNHVHSHAGLRHSHPHFPDIHHSSH